MRRSRTVIDRLAACVVCGLLALALPAGALGASCDARAADCPMMAAAADTRSAGDAKTSDCAAGSCPLAGSATGPDRRSTAPGAPAAPDCGICDCSATPAPATAPVATAGEAGGSTAALAPLPANAAGSPAVGERSAAAAPSPDAAPGRPLYALHGAYLS